MSDPAGVTVTRPSAPATSGGGPPSVGAPPPAWTDRPVFPSAPLATDRSADPFAPPVPADFAPWASASMSLPAADLPYADLADTYDEHVPLADEVSADRHDLAGWLKPMEPPDPQFNVPGLLESEPATPAAHDGFETAAVPEVEASFSPTSWDPVPEGDQAAVVFEPAPAAGFADDGAMADSADYADYADMADYAAVEDYAVATDAVALADQQPAQGDTRPAAEAAVEAAESTVEHDAGEADEAAQVGRPTVETDTDPFGFYEFAAWDDAESVFGAESEGFDTEATLPADWVPLPTEAEPATSEGFVDAAEAEAEVTETYEAEVTEASAAEPETAAEPATAAQAVVAAAAAEPAAAPAPVEPPPSAYTNGHVRGNGAEAPTWASVGAIAPPSAGLRWPAQVLPPAGANAWPVPLGEHAYQPPPAPARPLAPPAPPAGAVLARLQHSRPPPAAMTAPPAASAFTPATPVEPPDLHAAAQLAASPAHVVASLAVSTRPFNPPAAKLPAPARLASAEPARSAAAAESGAEGLWFMAPTSHGLAADAAAVAADEPTPIATMFWTLLTGAAVVAVVLIFLQLFTNLLR